jgi:hypothetical protein
MVPLNSDEEEFAVLQTIPERRHAAHPHPLPFRGGDLVADASPMTSRSNSNAAGLSEIPMQIPATSASLVLGPDTLQ